MSEEDKPLEFSAFDLMPEWAQKPAEGKSETRAPRRDREERENRGNTRKEQRGPGGRETGRGRGGGGFREGGGYPRGDRRDPSDRGGQRGPRTGGQDRREGRGRREGPGRGRRDDFRDERRDRPAPQDYPAPGISMVLEPTDASVTGLGKHIRETLRAFPLADLAKMIVMARERYQARFRSDEKGPSLYQCCLDSSLWLTKEEAVNHLLNGPLLDRFYTVEEIEVPPPSGNFTVVAVCGMSGTILGPPNHHEYQRNVARLHAEKFSNLPLDRFKSRIVMESGEEAIERWKSQIGKRLQYRLKREGEPASPEVEADTNAPEGATAADAEAGTDASTVMPESNETAESVPEEAANPDDEASSENAITGESGESEPVAEVADAEAPTSESPENSGKEPDETDAEAVAEPTSDGDGDGEGSESEELKDAVDAAGEAESPVENDALVLKTPEELARHFREHFADEVIVEKREAVVRGDIPARNLSRGLLAHLKAESEQLRRGFPLAMVQALCRAFEKEGLRFFKRGRKALHVSAVRPQALDPNVSLTGQIQAIIDFVTAKSGCKVVDLLEALAADFKKPGKDVPPESVELTDDSRAVLKDLRWLTSEGYLIEYPDTRLALGKGGRTPPKTTPAAGEPAREAKAKRTRRRRTRAPAARTIAGGGDLSPDETEDPLVLLDSRDEDLYDMDALPASANPV